MTKSIYIIIGYMLHDEEFFYFFFISFYTLWIVFFLLHLSFFSTLSFGIFHDFDTDVYIKVGNYILHFLELSKNNNLLKNSSEMLKHFRLASLMYMYVYTQMICPSLLGMRN